MENDKHTKGPLTVALSKERPFDIETRDASGALVFRRHLPCTSSDDLTPEEAMACVHFKDKEGCFSPAYGKAQNKRALADEIIRAAAPDLLAALEGIRKTLASGMTAGNTQAMIWYMECATESAAAAIAKARA